MYIAIVTEIYGDGKLDYDCTVVRANTVEELYEELAEYKTGEAGWYGDSSGSKYEYMMFRESDCLNFNENSLVNTKAWKNYLEEVAIRRAERDRQQAEYNKQNEARQYQMYLTLKEKFEPLPAEWSEDYQYAENCDEVEEPED